MSSFITDLFKTEPHLIEEVQLGLEQARTNGIDLIHLMKMHHDFLQESISVLTGASASDAEKQLHLYRFFRLVEMHGKAEEEVLYTELRKSLHKDARMAGFAAQDEHDVAFMLEGELLQMGYHEAWNEEIAAKGKVVAGLVQNHIKEEERHIFPVAQKVIPPGQLDTMVLRYIDKCRIYLEQSLETSALSPLQRMAPAETRYFNLHH